MHQVGVASYGSVGAYWPLQEIADTHSVWCMAFKKGVGGGSCIAQSPCSSIAMVWEMQMRRGKKRMIDSCIKASK